jgi:16S rRNA (uracil1498-N3)-methyltransferase
VSGHRFFLPAVHVAGNRVSFPPHTSRQISRVLRLKIGDVVEVFDGAGQEHCVRLEELGREAFGAIVRSFPSQSEPDIFVTLYQGLLKGKKLELVLQKCTEIGVSRFVPVRSERAVAGEPSESRFERLLEIVREAAEQSGRGVVPLVEASRSLAQGLAEAAVRGRVLFLWEEESLAPLPAASDYQAGSELSLFVGPEGGFGEAEAASARAAGAEVVSLGRRILRAETAAIVASALVLQGH